jgi:oligoribonuclease NrnB/cAMP/cGMP phosphodiesterase (DHH superfamily)
MGDKAIYQPWQYGDEFPVPTPDVGTVFLLDLNFPIDELVKMVQKMELTIGRSATIIMMDHHISALRAWEDHPDMELTDDWWEHRYHNIQARIDLEHSGARMAWDFFTGDARDEMVPDMIKYIEDRDLWRFQLPDSQEYSAALASYPFTFESYEIVVGLETPRVIEEGKVVLRFKDENVNRICDESRIEDISGHMVPVVNSTLFWSEVGHELLERYPDAPFAMCWFVRKSGNKLLAKHSLRSRGKGEFDVSELAKQFGGGGHAAAAGFEFEWHEGTSLLSIWSEGSV